MVLENTLAQLLTITLFDNELWRYGVFLIFIFLSYPSGKIINYILNNYLWKWAEKTEFRFDDILIKSLNPPINMFVFAGFFYIGSTYINQGATSEIFATAFNLLLIVPVVYFLIKFSTEAIAFYLKEGKKGSINEAAIDLLMGIVRIGLFLIGGLLILSNLGYNISALLAGLGVGGLAFALAAQDILKNFFAGIALIFDKTFNKGERVNFQGNAGFIEELKMRSTKLRTYDGTLLTIPNAMLADNIVENVTKVPRVKISMVIGVTYDTSVKKLKEAKGIIEKAIKDEKESDEKSTWIYFDEFAASSLNIQVIYYSKKLTMADWPARVHMKERINFAIKEGFEKAGISMAFPTQTLDIPQLDTLYKKESTKNSKK
jgi:MscS family membrane protein